MDSFVNVAGHENAKKLLLAALESKKIAHGYLFIGVAKVGKFLMAKEFAKSLSCQSGIPGNPCGKCPKCTAIENETDPDVLFVNSPKNKDSGGVSDEKNFSIENIRALQHYLMLFPYNSKYKIAIVNEAHKFTNQAINAFLKTLEEPKGNSIIILVADESKFLLKTLISRMQVVRFWPLQDKVIENFLISRGVEEKKAKEISLISSGKPGLAVEFSKSERQIADYHEKEKEFWGFTEANLPEKMIFLENLSKKEENIADILRFWLLCLRSKLLKNYFSGSSIGSARCDMTELKKIVNFADNLIIILNLINNSNINKRLALEILALEI